MRFSFFADNGDPFFRQNGSCFVKFGYISEVLSIKVVNDEKNQKNIFLKKDKFPLK